MKNLMKSLVVAFGFSVLAQGAQAKTIARVQFVADRVFVATQNMPAVKLATVALEEEGFLDITVQEFKNGKLSDVVSKEEIALNKSVFQKLKSSAEALSDAVVVTETHPIVCMMMPLFSGDSRLYVAQGYDYQTEKFAGELRAVYEPGACWKHSVIKLKNSYENDIASLLKDELTILGMQFAN